MAQQLDQQCDAYAIAVFDGCGVDDDRCAGIAVECRDGGIPDASDRMDIEPAAQSYDGGITLRGPGLERSGGGGCLAHWQGDELRTSGPDLDSIDGIRCD
jgi:hypothetical protein